MSYITINGLSKPIKPSGQLEIDLDRAYKAEGLFNDSNPLLPFIEKCKLVNPSEGYHYTPNKFFYDTIWEKVFNSLTGEHLRECVNQTIVKNEKYLDFIEKTFGSIGKYIEVVSYHPQEVHGVNLGDGIIISKDKKNLALLVDEFHEIGHRVFPKSADTYHHELGANYFMCLAFQKTNLELELIGVSIPEPDYGIQVSEDHAKSLKKAMNLVKAKIPYIHIID